MNIRRVFINYCPFIFLSIISVCSGFFLHNFDQSIPSGFDSKNAYGEWNIYEQVVDHFSEGTSPTFWQGYYAVSAYYKKGGPIILMLGQWDYIFYDTYLRPLAFDIAEKYDGYFFYLEHRYFGESNVVEDTSTLESLQWLTLEQVLADIDGFIEFVRNDLLRDANAEIILIGDQYGGSLAVWYHHSYPGVVNGVWATSANLLAHTDFPEFLETVGENIVRIGGDDCYNKIKAGVERAERLFENKEFEKLLTEYPICNASGTEHDIRIFSGYIAFLSTTETSYETIDTHYCKGMKDEPTEYALGTLLRKLFHNECFSIDRSIFENFFKYFRKWAYLYCSGLGWIPNTSSDQQPFGKLLSVDIYYESCESLFGKGFHRYHIDKRTDEINSKYGGLNPMVENVLFVNGAEDPNAVLQVRSPLNSNTTVITIPGIGWVNLLLAISDKDTPHLITIKEEIISIIGSFLWNTSD